jgi:hypothetical protein
MDIQEDTSGETGRHHWNKEPRLKTAAISEEGEDNWEQHKRMEKEMGAHLGSRTTQQDLQKDGRMGDQKANDQNFHYTV